MKIKTKYGYVAQTTLSVDDTKDIINKLKIKFPEIKEKKVFVATTNRQSAVKNIAKLCEMFFI